MLTSYLHHSVFLNAFCNASFGVTPSALVMTSYAQMVLGTRPTEYPPLRIKFGRRLAFEHKLLDWL